MSFRIRLTLLAASAVAVAIVGTSFAVYYTDRAQQFDQVDNELRASLNLPALQSVVKNHTFRVSATPGPAGFSAVKRLYGGLPKQLILPGSLKAVRVSVAAHGRSVSLADGTTHFFSTKVGGVHSRVLTLSSPAANVRITTSLVDVDHNLSRLKWLLVFISIGGAGVAGILGLLVANRALAPLRRLTLTTERIVDTGDLSKRTGLRGRDEISRLSARLDELLASLESSLAAQRQLVADASHELRTPIATLRANMELLADARSLGDEERTELLQDVRDELEAMTLLVGELVELARGEEVDVPASEFRLDEIVRGVVDRAARRWPAVEFRSRLEPCSVVGVPQRVERAVSNLVDNAGKWSPDGAAVVDVSVRDGVVEVRDHGPGIDEQDAPLVFNRFYRSAAARALPGAGLGLAIVKQIADAHGGSVRVENAPGGGAVLRLQLSPSR
jgi:two-component system, OmpR family, sensor histidine kinase MprB